jgi:hypothetical protein
MAFLVDGQNVGVTPGTVWPSQLSVVPGLAQWRGSAIANDAEPTRNGERQVDRTLTPGASRVSVEVDVPAQSGYLEPVTFTANVTA